MKNLFIYHKGKRLRCGYTTGTCAAAAAKASAYMLLHQRLLEEIEITTPGEVTLQLELNRANYSEHSAASSIIKDAGDDHDSTDGIEIVADVSKRTDGEINILGGVGIGTFTKPGFWGEVGEPAINPVPKEMIHTAVSSVSDCGWDITISAPQGEEIARKTLNKKLGIEGGISIIGTKGIVEPMSVEALKQTIYLEIDAIHKDSPGEILLFLGNYGQNVAKELKLEAPSVKISNFIGDAVLYCKNLDFQKVTLIGHIGKLCKLSIGAFYTHSSACDLRMEAFVYYLALAGASNDLIHSIAKCTDTEEALDLLEKNGHQNIVTEMRQGCIDRIREYVKDPDFNIDVLIYSMKRGLL